ncbi:MAG: hypothetical protein K2I63_02940, partial [Helicobacter sp.]|nr:hypothetical protein [Helicobacter sp.]
DTLIKKQDFKEYFSLTFQFSFLRDTDLYKKVLSLGERLFANMLELERLFDYQEAKKLANILLAFPTLKRSAQERIVFIQQKESLLEAIDKKDIKRVYTLVDEIENLRYLAPFKEFTNDFLRLYEEAKPFAYRGNAVQIMSILHDYMGIVYWVDKIAFLMKTAYLRQISDALSEMDVNWNLTLKRYLDRFGKGIELVKLLEDTRCKAVLDSFEGDGKADGYRHQSFVENIVIYIV